MIQNILRGNLEEGFVKWFLLSSCVLMGIMAVVAYAVATPEMVLGILTGGMIATLNCVGLNRDCKRVMRWRSVFVYYAGLAVRLALVALVVTVALLVFPGVVSPVGLFVGLSVVVATFYMMVLAMVIHRFRVKEAV